MEQARKRLVELLLEVDYVTSKDPGVYWWEKDVTVGAISRNYRYYKYTYSLIDNYDGKNGLFRIEHDSIWSVLKSENNMSDQQVKDFTESTLGERYNFGDITTINSEVNAGSMLGEHYNFIHK